MIPAKYYSNNTIFFMTGNNLKYLLSILNSKLAKWYFNQISTSSGMGTNRWLKYKIELLPVKNIPRKKQEPFIDLVDKIIETKKFEKNVNSIESQIDQLVYQLYNLTSDEIQIVESSIK